MSNGLVGFKDEFIKKLSETYPEKAVFLMGMDFEIVYLIEYIKDNNLTPDTFVPSEFKKYIDSQSSFYQYYSTPTTPMNNPATGVLFYDTATQTLKVYDGKKWTLISH